MWQEQYVRVTGCCCWACQTGSKSETASSQPGLPVACVLSGVENGKPTHFTVYTKGAGKAPLNVQFSSPLPGDAVRDLDIIDNYDYSHTVKYTPTQQVGALFPLSAVLWSLCCGQHGKGHCLWRCLTVCSLPLWEPWRKTKPEVLCHSQRSRKANSLTSLPQSGILPKED